MASLQREVRMPSSVHLEIASLVLGQRWGAVATLEGGAPTASMAAYANEPGLDGLLFFLSLLSAHTRNMLQDPRVSLAITTPDTGEGDPQLLPRVSLQGRVTEVPRDTEEFEAAGATYLERFPEAKMRFQLGDFKLLRFVVEEARYVGGFGRAVSLSGDELREAARAIQS